MPKPKDITGQKFGRLVAISLMEKRKHGEAVWECQCDCGNVVQVISHSLQSGHTKSCGCLNRESRENNIKDITGQRFGRLVVNRLTDKRINTSAVWECKCDCGNVIEVTNKNLQSGSTKSCGCLQKEIMSQLYKENIKDITGQRFGRLEVIRLVENRANDGATVWKCKCDCGNVVLVKSSSLRRGGTKSCGCLNHEKIVEIGKGVDLNKRFGLIDNTLVSKIRSKKPRKDSKTGHRGIHVDKRGRYVAKIGFKNKSYYLGSFNTLGEAVEVRKQAEEMLFEPFIKWYEENYLKGVGSPHGEENS